MLRSIFIKDFAIIDNLELDLAPGMTVITGETGAGKSIVIDALDIGLGDRADSSLIRHGAARCEINIIFDIHAIPAARNWLEAHEMLNDNECLIRRVIPQDGRSKNFINGSAVTLQQLRELGELLVHVHGQHQHQALLKKEEQRDLLDAFCKHSDTLAEVKNLYAQFKNIEAEIKSLSLSDAEKDAQKHLLDYQINELTLLNLQEGELSKLHQEQQTLAHAEELMQGCQQALDLLSENEQGNIQGLLSQAQSLLANTKYGSAERENITRLLDVARIQIEEASTELKHYFNTIELNPEKLQEVEQRLSKIYDQARKHKINPENLIEHFQKLTEQLQILTSQDARLEHLTKELTICQAAYQQAATKLSKNRVKKAKELSAFITQAMQELGMEGGKFAIDIAKAEASAYGIDKIEFVVSANPGQPLQALAKVASGGELSRISLAIQVITAQRDNTPTLVFDEVDVGIGGATAAIVGGMLKKLGQAAQVLCITHLPQVAACGNSHLKIGKKQIAGETYSQVSLLNTEERVEEVARMLGGVKITQQSLLHAKEMLEV